jgi:2-polyprenyl-6-methoxyphenol hydroxylase-like FAD-dependent oxidoreductase
MSNSKVVIIGAGPAGLAVGLSLARRGRQVAILERDTEPPSDNPADAFERWVRPGVPHLRLPHSLLGRARRALREHAPDVLEALLRAGAWENDLGTRLVRDAAGPGDEDLIAVHCRRPFFEAVLRRAAQDEPLVSIVSDTKVEGLTLRPDGAAAPRVTGVRLHDQSVLDADVVVDAGGRRSPIRSSLKQAGVPMPTAQMEPCGLIYYLRYYRLVDGVDLPAWAGTLGPSGTTDCARFSVFFGDNQTFAIVLGVPTSVHAFRALVREPLYTEAISRFKPLAPFIDPAVAEPITDVVAFGSLQNVFVPALLNGAPPVRGLHFVGDAYCHTNPLFAWGLCLALDYGFRLGHIIDERPTDVEAQALAFAKATSIEAEQCFHAVAEEDRDRTLTWDGAPPSGSWLGRAFAGFVRDCAQPAVMIDPIVARAVLRRAQLLDLPDDLMQQEAILQRVIGLQSKLPKPAPGSVPTKDELLEIVAKTTPAPAG